MGSEMCIRDSTLGSRVVQHGVFVGGRTARLTLGPLRSGRPLRPGIALRPLRSGRSLRPGIALRPLCADVTLGSLRSGRSLWPGIPLGSLGPDRPLRPGRPLRAWTTTAAASAVIVMVMGVYLGGIEVIFVHGFPPAYIEVPLGALYVIGQALAMNQSDKKPDVKDSLKS